MAQHLKLKATFLAHPNKMPHKYKRLGVVIVHDAKTKITFSTFDCRYKGKRSRYGRYIRELHAEGVDVTDLLTPAGKYTLEKDKEELAITIAKRLYAALVKRTIFEKRSGMPGNSTTSFVTTNEESWDWTKPGAKQSRYYQMAAKLLKEYDHDTVLSIVNVITGYA